ncbi:MAG: phosphatidylglycerophosphatase A [Mucilaginibacter sp.]|uniref:phosphatidylglycerophosphatase A family protein n=1 Tax=Mucilaginibacter sp. TaxID=1882438 RepID=UPI003265E667
MFHKIFSTGLGIGYIGKGSGTYASVACCIVWYLLLMNGYPGILALVITIAITAIGIWSSTVVEKIWGEDPQRVVIDEIAGMCISLLFLPVNVKYLIAGLILFRFFDIVKPLGIRKMEGLKGGWGIMLDDVLAGVYANLILQIIWWFKLM